MAGINYDNYKIHSSIDGKIYIGKVETKNSIPGFTLYSSKSGDRTDECVKAVMLHMNSLIENDEAINFQLPEFGTLTWKPEATAPKLKQFIVVFWNRVAQQTQTFQVAATNEFRAGRAFYRAYNRKTYHPCIQTITEVVL